MNTKHLIQTIRKTFLFIFLTLLSQHSWSSDYIASVSFSRGTVTAIDADSKLPRLLRRGHKVRVGEIIKTDPKSMVQLVFLDQSMLYIKANSTVVVEEFRLNEEKKKDAMVTKLVKGSVRALTGLIGKRDPENVRFKSPAGTIGIRGTALEITEATTDNTYAVLVDFGRIIMTNMAGEIEIEAGQSASSGGLNELPVKIPYQRPKNDSKNVAECMVRAKTDKDYNGCRGIYKNLRLEELLFMTAMANQVPGFIPKTLTSTFQELAQEMSVADSAILLEHSSRVYPELTPILLKEAVKNPKMDIPNILESILHGLDKPSSKTLDEVINTAIDLGLTPEDAMKVLKEVQNQGICK